MPTLRVKILRTSWLALLTRQKGWEEFCQRVVLAKAFCFRLLFPAYAKSHTSSSTSDDNLLFIAFLARRARYRLASPPPLGDPLTLGPPRCLPLPLSFSTQQHEHIALSKNTPNHNSWVFFLPSGNDLKVSVVVVPGDCLPGSLSATPAPGPTRHLPLLPPFFTLQTHSGRLKKASKPNTYWCYLSRAATPVRVETLALSPPPSRRRRRVHRTMQYRCCTGCRCCVSR